MFFYPAISGRNYCDAASVLRGRRQLSRPLSHEIKEVDSESMSPDPP